MEGREHNTREYDAGVSDRTLGPGASSVSDQTELAFEATSTSGPGARPVHPRGTGRGALVDRYVVIDVAGTGAMGMVLAAYDPQLDRKVAVKLLKFSGEQAQTRLQREAQALAKLDHRNVVGVYDVGTHEGQLFMAMEFVDGQTLGKWMAERPRPWPEVVRILSEAGRGLAAAHAAGLVHRDFKPENVMLGRDGRVRVMDFGLARTSSLTDDGQADLAATFDAALSELSGSRAALAQNVTRTGALLGTPAYMSPEQFAGKTADARSDQFGFCIALHEALYGQRPFVATSLADLLAALDEGRVLPAPSGTHVPPWLRKVVLRGLAPRPADRWPSMAALLDALADDPRVRRRRWIAGVLTVALLGFAVHGLLGRASESDDSTTCAGLDEPLVGLWDDARRREVRDAVLATALSYAPGTWSRIEPALDDYARVWVDARVDACEASARGEQSSELLDLRMACLDRRLTHMRATVDVLAQADATTVEHAHEALERLPTMAECGDREALLDEHPAREPALAAALERLEPIIIKAETLGYLGHPQRGVEGLLAIVEQSDALGDEVTRARVRLVLGRLQQAVGDYQAAEVTLRESYRAAILAGSSRDAAAAARALVDLVGGGTGLVRPAEGLAWAFHADVLTRAAGTREDYADYRMEIGEVEKMAGNYAVAREHFEQALLGYEQLRPEHPKRIEAITSLANIEIFTGDVEQSLGHYRQALAILQQTYDPTHPSIGRVYISLGEAESQAGRWAEARADLEAGVAVFEQALGPDHPTIGFVLGTLGYVAGWQGDFAAGRRAFERSVAILEATVGRDHYYYSDAVGKLGAVEFLAGDYAAAGTHYEFARASLERQMGSDHPSVGIAFVNLAELALTEGRLELALEHADAALAILEPKLGLEHLDLALPLETRGQALLGLARASEAVAPLERALAIHQREQHGEASLVELRAALERARSGASAALLPLDGP